MKVYICMILLGIAIQDGWAECPRYHYPNLATLKHDAMYICCHSYVGRTWGRGNRRRGLGVNSVPSSTILARQQAVSYNRWRWSDATGLHSGILNECCMEANSCSHEEVDEGYSMKPEELGHECITEGCCYEEIAEHCPN